MQTPQAWMFIWIVFCHETFPLFKRSIMEAGHTCQNADRKTLRSLTMLHAVLSEALSKCRWESSLGKYVFWISERAIFSVEACLLHSCVITVRLRKWLQKRLGAPPCTCYFTFTDRNSFPLCAVLLADGMWSLTWFFFPNLGISVKKGKMEPVFEVWPNSGMNVSAHLERCSAEIQAGGRSLRLSAPQRSVSALIWSVNGMSAHH